MLPDGSNPEGVDPVPPLDWKSKADLKDVVVHGHSFSPPTTKVRAFLKFYGIPFKFKEGLTGKQGSKHYKRFPVVDVAGRQVNDSFIILKNLLPALTDDFNTEWETKIVFDFQTSIEIFAGENPDEAPLFISKLVPVPHFLIRHVLRRVLLRAWRAKTKEPGYSYVEPLAFLCEFAAAMAGDFFHGASAGQVDISLYSTLAPFCVTCPSVLRLLSDAGLQGWLDRMTKVVPLAGTADALYPAERVPQPASRL